MTEEMSTEEIESTLKEFNSKFSEEDPLCKKQSSMEERRSNRNDCNEDDLRKMTNSDNILLYKHIWEAYKETPNHMQMNVERNPINPCRFHICPSPENNNH